MAELSQVIRDALLGIYRRLEKLEERTSDLSAEHGEIVGIHFATTFPTKPYPNQIMVRTDQTPPDGGTLYRWDEASSQWLPL